MRCRKRHLTAAALALAAAGVITAGAGASPASFTDPAGDSGAAPDITNVAVSDNGAGSVTVAVTASTLTSGASVDVYLNTDKNGSTGSPSGSELHLEAWQDTSDAGWDIQRWGSSDWQETPQSPAEHFTRSGNVYTWTFGTEDTGPITGFDFWAGGFMADAAGDLTARDEAPDGGDWVYDLSAAAPAIVPAIGKPLAVPSRPRAGKLLSLSFPLTRADTGAVLTGATLAASTSIAGKPVARTVSQASGAAHVNVLLPRTAKGKVLRVALTVTLGAKTTTRVFSYVVA
jgi:hypothetical protein